MSDVDLIINVHTNGIKDVANLSASVKALTANLREITIPMTKLDVQSRAVNKALGVTSRGMKDHANSIKELKQNQRALGEESKRLKKDIAAYTGAIRAAGGPTTALGKELTSTRTRLQAMGAGMRGARVRAFGSDISNVSLKMQKMGKDAQFVGRSLMINLTAPIMLFGRLGFQSLLAIDKESTRLSKVFDSVAMSAEQAAIKVGLLAGEMPDAKQTAVINGMLEAFKELDSGLTSVSSKFGVSKDIVVGLASDFAELGIIAQDNVIQLTELTTTIEKLGGMDIGPAKDLSQALYFNSRRAFEANGAFRLVTDAVERETMAIRSAQTQLAMFNAIENVTALTLQDLADALPEVGSMATAFGLSMTEAAAMLAPMKSAGLDVGASATSIKTSLQRLILPTAKNIKFMAQLASQYGVTTDATNAFNLTTKTGLVGLAAIVDVFSKIKDSAAGTEGALKLMSQMFEKRQGPRMYIAIEQLALFNKELNTLTRRSGSAEGALASQAEKAIVAYNKLNNTTLKETIDNFRDIGILARVAAGTKGTTVDGYKGAGAGGALASVDIAGAKAARAAVATRVREDRAKGKDSFAGVTSEAGRAMLVELAGPITATEIANNELDISLASLSVSVQKIKNNFKLFAAEILKTLGPAIKWLSKKLEDFQKFWKGLAQSTKDSVALVVTGVLVFLALIGPAVILMGTFQASIGVLGRGFAHFLPKIRNAEGGLVAFGSSAEVARHKIDRFYQSIRNKASGALEAGTRAGMKSMGTLDAAGIAVNQSSGTVGKAVRAGAAVNLAGNVAPVPEDFSLLAKGSPERAAVVAKNRAARLTHAASGRGAVDQYMRNEAQMLGKKGMRLNAAGRVIGPGSSGFVGGGMLGKVSDASALRESRFAARGLTRGTGGEVFRTTRKGIERQITESQGMRLARGGIGSKMTSVRLGATEAVRSIGGAPAKAMQGYRNSVLGAKAALRAMRVEQMAVGGGSFLKTAMVAMKGFASATKLGTIALKLFKFAMISTGIGVVIAAVGIAILVIVKNFDKFKEAGAGAFATIKEAFNIFKNALKEIARPFLDLFAMFGKGGKEGKTAVGGLAAAFGKIATAVKWVAGIFQKFVMNVIQPYLYAIINIVMFVVSIFKGNWGEAFDFLKAAVYQVVKFVVQGFALLIKGVIQVVAFGIKLVIGYFTLIPKAVAKSFSWLSKLPGMGFLKSIGNGIDNVIDGMYGMVDAAKAGALGAVDSLANAITKGLDKGISKGVKKSEGAIKIFGNNTKDEAEAAGESIAGNMGEGFEKGDLGGKMKKAIEEVLQTLQDYVAGELKNAVDKYVTQAENALKKQKDAALKVFEVQIETLGKLEKAQESLTKTMAYESEKRKRIDDKALTDEQYRRNYALAVYEGRTDDARMLQLQQGADEKAFSEDIKAIETKRAKELAKENLDALKTAINEAKDAAGKFFDESLIKFQEAAALVTKFPPVTIQDYQDQVGKLHTITTDASLANSEEFGKMFEAFATTINDKMPNKVIGAFSMNLDELVVEAQRKYGLGGNPDEKSIIGATLGMLADIGGVFGDKKQEVVDAFGLVSTGLVGNFDVAKTEILRIVDEEFLTPFAEASLKFVTNWETIYTQAFIDGNKSIIDSFRNTVALNKDLMAEMAKNLDPAVNKWLALKAAIDAANDAAAAGGGGGGDGSDSTMSRPSSAAGGRADVYSNMFDRGYTNTYQEFITGTGQTTQQAYAAANLKKGAFMPKPAFVPTSSSQTGFKGYAKGGVIPSRSSENGYIGSGFINAPTQEGVPALLHGGEYIVNAKAVARLGIGALEKLNNNLIPRFAKGGYVAPKKGGIPFGGEDKILANSTKKAPQALQGPYATSIPVLASPTINLKKVPIVKNNMPGKGGYSTVRTASFGVGGGELLLPTVVQGKILSNTNAFNAFANGGYKNHLGLYANSAAASKAAEVIHLSEANKFEKITKANIQRSGIYPGMQVFAPAAAPQTMTLNGATYTLPAGMRFTPSNQPAQNIPTFSSPKPVTDPEQRRADAIATSLANAKFAKEEADSLRPNGFQRLLGFDGKGNDIRDMGSFGGMIKGLANIPLGLTQITGELVVGAVKSFGTTFSGKNAREYLNFGKTGPGWQERGLRVLEDVINVASVVPLVRGLTAGPRLAVGGAIKKYALKDAAAVLEKESGINLLTGIKNMAGGNTYSGLKTQGFILKGLETEALASRGMGLKDVMLEHAMTLRNKGAMDVDSWIVKGALGPGPAVPAGVGVPDIFGGSATGSYAGRKLASDPASKLDFANLVKIGEKAGSHPGGFYKDQVSQIEYYLKQPTGHNVLPQDLIENELLANALYREVGVATNKLQTIMTASGPALISEIIPKTPFLNTFKEQFASPDFTSAIQKDFAVDAWLGNYDVIGADTPNILNSVGGPVRIDAGGAMKFSGTGRLKSSFALYDKFGPIVGELKSMLTGGSHRSYDHAASVFGSMSPEALATSAKSLQSITPERISEIVRSTITNPESAQNYIEILIARRNDILNQLIGNREAIVNNPAASSVTDDFWGSFTEPATVAPVKKPNLIEKISDKYYAAYDKINKKFFTKNDFGQYTGEEVNANRVQAGLQPFKLKDEFDSLTSYYKNSYDKYGNPILPTTRSVNPTFMFADKPRLTMIDLLETLNLKQANVQHPMMTRIFTNAQRAAMDKYTSDIMLNSTLQHGMLAESGVDIKYPGNSTAKPYDTTTLELLVKASEYEAKLGYVGKYTKAHQRLQYPTQIYSDAEFEQVFNQAGGNLISNARRSGLDPKTKYPMYSIKTGRGSKLKDTTIFGSPNQIGKKNILGTPEIGSEIPRVVFNPGSQNFIPRFVYEALTSPVIPQPRFEGNPFLETGQLEFDSLKYFSQDQNNNMIKTAYAGKPSTPAYFAEAIDLMVKGADLSGLHPELSPYILGMANSKEMVFAGLRSFYPSSLSPNGELLGLAEIIEQIGFQSKHNPEAQEAYVFLFEELMKDYNMFLSNRTTTQAGHKGFAYTPAMGNELSFAENTSRMFSELLQSGNSVPNYIKDFMPDDYADAFYGLTKPSLSHFHYDSVFGIQRAAKLIKVSDLAGKYNIPNMSAPLAHPITLTPDLINSNLTAEQLLAAERHIKSQEIFRQFGSTHEQAILQNSLKLNYAKTLRPMEYPDVYSPIQNLPFDFLLKNKLINDFEFAHWSNVLSTRNYDISKLFHSLMLYRMNLQSGTPLTGEYFKIPTLEQSSRMITEKISFLEAQYDPSNLNPTALSSPAFTMANNSMEATLSLLDPIFGSSRRSSLSTANTGDILDMEKIWNFDSVVFPLPVKPTVETLPAFERLKGTLSPFDVGVHSGAIPGLTKLKPPANLDREIDNTESATADSPFWAQTTYKPITGKPLLKGATYSFSGGALYVPEAYDLLKLLVQQKNGGASLPQFTGNLKEGFGSTKGITARNFEAVGGAQLAQNLSPTNAMMTAASQFFDYDPSRFGKAADGRLVSPTNVMFSASELNDALSRIFQPPMSGYIVRQPKVMPDPEGWQRQSVISSEPEVLARYQQPAQSQVPNFEQMKERLVEMYNSLIQPGLKLKTKDFEQDWENISPDFARLLHDNIDKSVINDIDTMLRPHEADYSIKGFETLQHKKALEYLQRMMNTLNSDFNFFGGGDTGTRVKNIIPGYKTGGYVPGAPSMAVPAILHGGEYVVNADAVRNMGVSAMQSINRSKFNVPSGSPSYSGGGTTSVSTVNINVDTFVGEEEWFKSMMKSYNVNVLPKMNKAAGNESRTFSSYNGIQ